jgi:hypothetical protein
MKNLITYPLIVAALLAGASALAQNMPSCKRLMLIAAVSLACSGRGAADAIHSSDDMARHGGN